MTPLGKPARRRPVAILNPAYEGKQYTSANNASRMVQRGIAVWIAASTIRLLSGNPQFTARPDWQDEQIDAAIGRNFAGGGSTIDICKKRHRRYFASDRKPVIEREKEIRNFDVTNSTPRPARWSDVKLIYLDPPYWKQIEGKYQVFYAVAVAVGDHTGAKLRHIARL